LATDGEGQQTKTGVAQLTSAGAEGKDGRQRGSGSIVAKELTSKKELWGCVKAKGAF